MTEEQFEALKRWIDRTAALRSMTDHRDTSYSQLERERNEAEQAAHDAFCGKTHEQPRG